MVYVAAASSYVTNMISGSKFLIMLANLNDWSHYIFLQVFLECNFSSKYVAFAFSIIRLHEENGLDI